MLKTKLILFTAPFEDFENLPTLLKLCHLAMAVNFCHHEDKSTDNVNKYRKEVIAAIKTDWDEGAQDWVLPSGFPGNNFIDGDAMLCCSPRVLSRKRAVKGTKRVTLFTWQVTKY